MLVLCLFFLSFSHAVEVDTEYGTVRGGTIELDDGTRVNSFKGIPFGQAERFQRSTPPEPWDDVWDAESLGPACYQREPGVLWLTHPFWDDYSEDCLNINIVTPEDMEGGPYPVMFYLYGGAYAGGANIQYPGHFLARKDVIVAIPNYRLGVLGFAYTLDGQIPGNAGLWDQYLALQFVRDNIAAFGGDPERITIFGQSAGAGSSGAMLISPHTQGMFQNAILQSGSEVAYWATNGPDQEPEAMLDGVAEYLNCTTEDKTEMIACLRDVDAYDLVHAPVECKPGYVCVGFAPVIDGDYIPDHPFNMRLNGSFAHVPMMVGITSEDGALYGPAVDPDIGNAYNRSEFLDFWRRAVDFFDVNIPDLDRKEDVFQALAFEYAPWPHIEDRERNRRNIVDACTDVGFSVMGDLHIKQHAAVVPQTYQYVFGYASRNTTELVPEWMGTTHTMDVPFVIGLPNLQLNEAVREDSEIYLDIIAWDMEDTLWAEYTMDLWTNFAKTGNPTPDPIKPPGDNPEITWPAFTNEELHYHFIDRTVENRVEYRQKTLAFWNEYLNYLSGNEEDRVEFLLRLETMLVGMIGDEESLGTKLQRVLEETMTERWF